MISRPRKFLVIAAAAATMIAPMAQAGGLADAITEREPEVIEQAAPAEMPGWVVPAVALLLIGVAVAASSGGDDDDDEPVAAAREVPDEPDDVPENTDQFEFDDDIK